MRFAFLLSSLLLAGSAQAEILYSTAIPTWKRSFAPVPSRLHVTDGDTVCYDYRPDRNERTCYRLYGVDTPELHIACEHDKGIEAKLALQNFMKSGKVLIKAARQKDKYGRTIAILTVDGKDAAKFLIDKDLGYSYLGGKRRDWC